MSALVMAHAAAGTGFHSRPSTRSVRVGTSRPVSTSSRKPRQGAALQEGALLQRAHAIAQLGGALEVEVLRGLLHLAAQRLDHRRDLLDIELFVLAVASLLATRRVVDGLF